MQEKIAKLQQFKLLFVEDEEDLINIISATLVKLRANFVTARNGQHALEVLDKNNDVDVIITDINMPIMNGLDMIKAIRNSNKPYKDVQIIIMSAHTETEYLDSAKALGIEEYLLKPFDFMKFIEFMASLENNG